MLITDKAELQQYTSAKRIWQGCPCVAVTPQGRVFISFTSGGVYEQDGACAMLLVSENGTSFGEPIAVAGGNGLICLDNGLWIDPLGRLWFTWAQNPDDKVYGVICEDPDKELIWSTPLVIGEGCSMNNKPTVLSNGTWLFPVARWKACAHAHWALKDNRITPRGSMVYASKDEGKTFSLLGGTELQTRTYDEHRIIERNDGSLVMYIRTKTGIGTARSFDGGKTWCEQQEHTLSGADSRFAIERLPSGRLLLINNDSGEVREKLTAYLSEDEGCTWPYKLLLDERTDVSYPGVMLSGDGYIYIAYDRERGCYKWSNFETLKSHAREILLARITEQDILDGELSGKGCYLKRVVSKLGEYCGKGNPWMENAHKILW